MDLWTVAQPSQQSCSQRHVSFSLLKEQRAIHPQQPFSRMSNPELGCSVVSDTQIWALFTWKRCQTQFFPLLGKFSTCDSSVQEGEQPTLLAVLQHKPATPGLRKTKCYQWWVICFLQGSPGVLVCCFCVTLCLHHSSHCSEWGSTGHVSEGKVPSKCHYL